VFDYSDSSSSLVPFIRGEAGVGAPLITYPQLCFNPANFFALGSPIAMILALRGLHSLGEDFSLPTCPAFFNIFHPVSYILVGLHL
jgi:DDHD domain